MELRKLTKKGQANTLAPGIVGLGIAAIVLILMLVILEDLRDNDLLYTNTANCNATSTVACGGAYQAANETLTGLSSFGDFWTIIVLAIVAGLVIGIIFAAFGKNFR